MFIYIALKFLKYKKFFEEYTCENENYLPNHAPLLRIGGKSPYGLFNVKNQFYEDAC